MPVLLLRFQEEEYDVLGAAQKLLTRLKASWHLYFFQNWKKNLVQGQRKANFFEIYLFTELLFRTRRD